MKKIWRLLPFLAVAVLFPVAAMAAGGGGAADLIVVADTRVIGDPVNRYFADLYNTNITLFAIWATALTAMYGCFLGFLMDFLMSKTGLDLTSRKIVEH